MSERASLIAVDLFWIVAGFLSLAVCAAAVRLAGHDPHSFWAFPLCLIGAAAGIGGAICITTSFVDLIDDIRGRR